jgi:hypothetical protein
MASKNPLRKTSVVKLTWNFFKSSILLVRILAVTTNRSAQVIGGCHCFDMMEMLKMMGLGV